LTIAHGTVDQNYVRLDQEYLQRSVRPLFDGFYWSVRVRKLKRAIRQVLHHSRVLLVLGKVWLLLQPTIQQAAEDCSYDIIIDSLIPAHISEAWIAPDRHGDSDL
jgi:hypothetical protein